jgi:hypothetical protein
MYLAPLNTSYKYRLANYYQWNYIGKIRYYKIEKDTERNRWKRTYFGNKKLCFVESQIGVILPYYIKPQQSYLIGNMSVCSWCWWIYKRQHWEPLIVEELRILWRCTFYFWIILFNNHILAEYQGGYATYTQGKGL